MSRLTFCFDCGGWMPRTAALLKAQAVLRSLHHCSSEPGARSPPRPSIRVSRCVSHLTSSTLALSTGMYYPTTTSETGKNLDDSQALWGPPKSDEWSSIQQSLLTVAQPCLIRALHFPREMVWTDIIADIVLALRLTCTQACFTLRDKELRPHIHLAWRLL